MVLTSSPVHTKIVRRRRARRPISTRVGDVLLALAVFLILLPFAFTVLTALRTRADVAANPISFPRAVTLDNFVQVYAKINYGVGLINSVIILLGSLILVIVIGALAAYPLARITRGWTTGIYRIFIAGSTVPIFVILAPFYLLERDFGLLNSYQGVIFGYTALNLPVAIFFYTSFFRQIPEELEEAASLDGAGPLRVFFLILFPLLRPITATLATFLTLSIWNDLVLPLVFLQEPSMQTVMVNAYNLIGPYNVDPTVLFPAALLGVAPLVLVFILLQRQVVSGLTMGAGK